MGLLRHSHGLKKCIGGRQPRFNRTSVQTKCVLGEAGWHFMTQFLFLEEHSEVTYSVKDLAVTNVLV